MTLYLDPSYNSSKFRSEFRLPKSNGVYKPDMRLLNIGVSKSAGGNTSYNILTGAYGVIDSLALYSGSQVVDQILHFSEYVSMKNLLHSNSDNQSLKRPLVRNKLGYVSTGLDVINAGTGVITKTIKQSNAVPNDFNTIYTSAATVAQQATNGSWLDLSECFGFLRASEYVPMNIYPDLRVVVNYKNSAGLLDIVTDRTALVETLEPLLVVEYETDPEVAEKQMREYQGISFETVEWDQVQMVRDTTPTDTSREQTASYLVKGFNDKYISKLVILNTGTDNSTWDNTNVNAPMTNQGSTSQIDWGFQVRMNGSNMFPKTEVEGKNRRLGMMVDSWGSMNLCYGQTITYPTNSTDIAITNLVLTNGQADYSGFKIDDVVKELKLNVSRTAVGAPNATPTGNTGLRQRLNLNMFGISRKRVIPTSSGLLIQYY